MQLSLYRVLGQQEGLEVHALHLLRLHCQSYLCTGVATEVRVSALSTGAPNCLPPSQLPGAPLCKVRRQRPTCMESLRLNRLILEGVLWELLYLTASPLG